MRHKFLIGLIFSLCILSSSKAQSNKPFEENDIQISWKLITNAFQQKNQFFGAFVINNNSNQPFPASGWTIYFNSSFEIPTADLPIGIHVTHVNGDIYKISPNAIFKTIQPKTSVEIAYSSNGLLINRTVAPSGLYIVWDNDPVNGYTIANYSIPELKNNTNGLITPEKIYQQNSIIKPISDDKIAKILPTPVSYKTLSGTFSLTGNFAIQSDPLFKAAANYLTHSLNKLMVSSSGNSPKSTIILQKVDMPKEAYQLLVSPQQVVIKAGSGAGIFYGIQSLFALMPSNVWREQQNQILIEAAEVNDAPRFGYRSLMFDVARNFKSKADIFRLLDVMALYKLNVFHFHFSDDEGWRIEIPSLPELTTIGAKRGHTLNSKTMLPPSYAAGPVPGKTMGSGYYTRADFIEILRYAAERYIEVIPEIESPGHSRAAIKAMDARYEKFMQQGNKLEAEKYLLRDKNDQSVYSSAQQWTDNVMCVALPSVYTFIDKVVNELLLMYKEAGAPLSSIHMGGDEVPAGAWEKSPICQQLIQASSNLNNTNDLWYYYYNKVNKIIQSKGLFVSGWEEVGMRKTKLEGENAMIVNPRMANDNFQLHVWNNMVGWGSEDLPYRLANAGYKVVLSPVSNNYFDLAYNKSPDEMGYYWGGFQDIDKPFYFIPYNYYKTAKENAAGNPIDQSYFVGKDRLTDFGKSNIVGLQGLLWSENVRSIAILDYLLLPKLLGLAERAWAKDPEWATENNPEKQQLKYNQAWSEFVHTVGKRELPKLNYYAGGFGYRIPTVGALVKDGKVSANIQFPGLFIRYTTDGTEPTTSSKIYELPIDVKGLIQFKAFDSKGRGSRTTSIENK